MRLLAVEISGWLKIHLIGLAEYFKMDNTDNIYLKLKQQRINIFKNSKYYRVFNKNNKQVKNNCTNNFHCIILYLKEIVVEVSANLFFVVLLVGFAYNKSAF